MVGRAPTGMGISPKSESRYYTTVSNISAFKIFKKTTRFFEKREIVAARFRFWGNAHTCWHSPDHKALPKCR